MGVKRRSRKDSLLSDCEKKKAEVMKVACFAQPRDSFKNTLIDDAKQLQRASSIKECRLYRTLNNLNEVSNQST